MSKTKQEVFDEVVTHLLTQNEQSYCIAGGLCAYRGSENRKCAIGALIADEHYSHTLEGEPACSSEVLTALRESGYPVTPDMRVLYVELQKVHDRYMPSLWVNGLRALADTDNELTFNWNPNAQK